ncbi:hypothetical protein LguiA_029597 [Lonicera macranthoides]
MSLLEGALFGQEEKDLNVVSFQVYDTLRTSTTVTEQRPDEQEHMTEVRANNRHETIATPLPLAILAFLF